MISEDVVVELIGYDVLKSMRLELSREDKTGSYLFQIEIK